MMPYFRNYIPTNISCYRSSKRQYLAYVFLRTILGEGWLWLWNGIFLFFLTMTILHRTAMMNIGAIKSGDSPNHAQQVDAPAAAAAQCNQ